MPRIAPSDCKHRNRLLIQASRGTPPPSSHVVYVCPQCGLFQVWGVKDGIDFGICFELTSEELVEAASQYLEGLRWQAAQESPEWLERHSDVCPHCGAHMGVHAQTYRFNLMLADCPACGERSISGIADDGSFKWFKLRKGSFGLEE